MKKIQTLFSAVIFATLFMTTAAYAEGTSVNATQDN